MPDALNRHGEEIAWTAISFFASCPAVQLPYVCETGVAFFAPSERVSRKGNYIAGVACLFTLYKNNFWDAHDLPEASKLVELSEALNAAHILRPSGVWEPAQLESHHAWKEIRELALEVLAEAGLRTEEPLQQLDVTLAASEFEWRELPEV